MRTVLATIFWLTILFSPFIAAYAFLAWDAFDGWRAGVRDRQRWHRQLAETDYVNKHLEKFLAELAEDRHYEGEAS